MFPSDWQRIWYDMSPKARLVASAVSGMVAILLFKVWLDSLGIPGVDTLLMFAPFGILFTIFAAVGVVNAFNLIDGLNGLSSYVTVSVAVSLSIMPSKRKHTNFNFFGFLVAAVLGFMAFGAQWEKYFWRWWRLHTGSLTRLVCDYSHQLCN